MPCSPNSLTITAYFLPCCSVNILFKRVVFGEVNNQELQSMKDLKTFEIITLTALVIPILFFGFYPEPLMNSIEASVENTLNMYNFDLINSLASKD